MNIVVLWIIFVICVFVSAFLAASESCFTNVNELRLEKETEKGDKKSKQAFDVVKNFDSTNSALLLGVNIAQIAASTVGALIANHYFAEKYGSGIADTIGTFGVFFIILILGEIIPKVIGTSYNYKLSKEFAISIKILKWICFPISWPVIKLTSLMFKVKEKVADENEQEDEEVSDDELIEMVDTIEDEGFIDESQSELLKSAIDFTDCSAMQIMTPRVDLFAFDIDSDINELTTDSEIFTHSRIPVYKDSLDNIIGMLRTVELLKEINNGNKNIDIRKMMVKPYYVPEAKQISSILEDFKELHCHVAIVKDEYGGTAGLLTLEDIVEELVGDIWDEMDVIEEDYKQKNENEFIVDGSMNLEDFFNLVELDIDKYEGESATVNGWVTEQIDEFPRTGDKFEYENLSVEIIEADEFTAEKIKVVRQEKVEE